uniref:Secreted protein n=1 Tax=Ixodes scapularis TaxID=6945 RepID=A0A4D5RYZ6_IXOSC
MRVSVLLLSLTLNRALLLLPAARCPSRLLVRRRCFAARCGGCRWHCYCLVRRLKVPFELGVGDTTLLAQEAVDLEGFGVHSHHVVLERLLLAERPIATLTRKGALARVPAHVCAQLAVVRVPLAAVGALVALAFRDMAIAAINVAPLLVCVQLDRRFEAHGAVVAAVRVVEGAQHGHRGGRGRLWVHVVHMVSPSSVRLQQSMR